MPSLKCNIVHHGVRLGMVPGTRGQGDFIIRFEHETGEATSLCGTTDNIRRTVVLAQTARTGYRERGSYLFIPLNCFGAYKQSFTLYDAYFSRGVGKC